MKTLFLAALSLGLCFAAPSGYAQVLQGGLPLTPDTTGGKSVERQRVEVFLDGNVKSAVSDGSSGPLTGSIGIRFLNSRTSSTWTALVNVAAVEDSLDSGFATSILAPASGTGAFQSGLLHYSKKFANPFDGGAAWWRRHLGVYVYASAGNSTWSAVPALNVLAEDLGTSPGELADSLGIRNLAESIGLYGFGAGVSWDVIARPLDDNNAFGITLTAGPIYRSISGNGGLDGASAFRQLLLGKDLDTFGGFEAGFQVRFNTITGALQYYGVLGSGIDGVHGGQLIIGISVNANLFTVATKS